MAEPAPLISSTRSTSVTGMMSHLMSPWSAESAGTPSRSSSTRLPVPRLYPLEPRMLTWLPTWVTPGRWRRGPDRLKELKPVSSRRSVTDMLTGASANGCGLRVAVTTTPGSSTADSSRRMLPRSSDSPSPISMETVRVR